ncbi:Crp/Fnr family transcriptional regulator [Enterovirga rhinocerotis]|uniref:CRP-like cAMP-binding protein n=1 Tax=Enterovirga rhinocerotis TaxID=1339210 RepID=A0A4R7C677_9HYPH|nr:Crp/Fnr family transcriptional regulator [Enterovirga rhinocerotis]TDR94080.1 CRP-like cAMP-binding protein [Enterovirga rhinocerotis]
MSRGPGFALPDLGVVFGALRPQSIERLEDTAEFHVISTGARVTSQGDVPTHFHLVQEGCLRLAHMAASGAHIGLGFAGPGDPVGWPSALRATPYATTAWAVTETRVLRWSRADFEAVASADPALLRGAVQFLCDRNDAMLAQLQEIVTEPVEQRLARAVLRIAVQCRDGIVIQTPPVSRQDLAELTGTTHFTVSRILKDWEEEALIANRRPRILVCDQRRLEERAEGRRGIIRRRRLPRSPAGRAAERHPER